jgi:hypothetical protein
MEYLINPVNTMQITENLAHGCIPFRDFTHLLESAIMYLEMADMKESDKKKVYLAVYGFKIDFRYTNTQHKLERDLYGNVIQDVTDFILKRNEEANLNLDITFNNNKYMTFVNFLTDENDTYLKSFDQLMMEIEKFVHGKYGDYIEVYSFTEQIKYNRGTHSILTFLEKIEKF